MRRKQAPAAAVSELGPEPYLLLREAQDYTSLVHGSRVDGDAPRQQRTKDWQKLMRNLPELACSIADADLKQQVLALHYILSTVNPAIYVYSALHNAVVDAVNATQQVTPQQLQGVHEALLCAMGHADFAGDFPDVAADCLALTTCHVAVTAAMVPAIREQLEAAPMDGRLRDKARASCTDLATKAAEYGTPRAEQAVRRLLLYVDPDNNSAAIVALREELRKNDFWRQQPNLKETVARIPEDVWRLLIEAAPQLLVVACRKAMENMLTYFHGAFERGLVTHFQLLDRDGRTCVRNVLRAFSATCSAARFLHSRQGVQSAVAGLIADALQPVSKPVMELYNRAFFTGSCPCEPFLRAEEIIGIRVQGLASVVAHTADKVTDVDAKVDGLGTKLEGVDAKVDCLGTDMKAGFQDVRRQLQAMAGAEEENIRLRAELDRVNAVLSSVQKSGVKPGGSGSGAGENSPMRGMALSPGQPGSAAPAGSPLSGAGHWATTTFMPR